MLNPNDPYSPTKNQNLLTYQFIDAFPTNITALPLSYEGSTITKTTINFSYTRYTTLKHTGVEITPNTSSPTNSANPDQPPLKSQQTKPFQPKTSTVITNEYYNNFGDNRQNATNTADFFGVA